MLGLRGRSLIGERFQDLRRGLPDIAEAFGEDRNVAVPQLDIVGRSRTRFQANRLTDDKRGSFRFGLADFFRRASAAISAVQKLVRQFMG